MNFLTNNMRLVYILKYLIVVSFFIFTSDKVYALEEDYKTSDPIRVVGDWKFPPYEYLNNSGNPDGFIIKLLDEVMKDCGYEYTLKLTHFTDAVEDVSKNKADLIIGYSYSDERNEKFHFSLTHSFLYPCIVCRKDSPLRSIRDLNGKDVIFQIGDIMWNKVQSSGVICDTLFYDNMEDGLVLLSEGYSDVAVCTEDLAFRIITENNLDNLEIRTLNIDPLEYCFATNRQNDTLINNINASIAKLKSNGVYDKLYSKWFGIYTSKVNYTLLYSIIGCIIFIISIASLFIILLRKEVKIATAEKDKFNESLKLAVKAQNLFVIFYDMESKKFYYLRNGKFVVSNITFEHIISITHEDDRDEHADLIKKLCMGDIHSAEHTIRMFSKTHNDYRYCHSVFVVTKDSSGKVKKVSASMNDVTDEYLYSLNLKEKDIINDLAIKTAKLALSVYDTETKLFTCFNEPINGFDSSVKLTLDNYLNAFNNEDLGEEWRKSTYIMENRLDEEYTFDVRVKTQYSDYKWRDCTVIGAPLLKDKEGKVTKYVSVREDNTRLIRLINDLEKAKNEANESNRLKSAFLANMSHEIRTPLNAIVGFSELLATATDEADREEFRKIISSNNDILLHLINDVLDLSKIESGSIDLNPKPFDIVMSFKSLYISFKPRAESLGLDFLYECKYDKCIVNLDEKRILQVISNFITNAMKFTKNGFIKIGFHYENEGIKIYCSDTGIGISKENGARVFDRFYKINSFAQGTGLGMAICKSIIEIQNGKIGFESREGAGSNFWAWIPCHVELY
jgi:signal transduction histidine kinase/ABC-type amino acid transport substrate-binding protein